jgi:hypothetical protein
MKAIMIAENGSFRDTNTNTMKLRQTKQKVNSQSPKKRKERKVQMSSKVPQFTRTILHCCSTVIPRRIQPKIPPTSTITQVTTPTTIDPSDQPSPSTSPNHKNNNHHNNHKQQLHQPTANS